MKVLIDRDEHDIVRLYTLIRPFERWHLLKTKQTELQTKLPVREEHFNFLAGL